MRLVFLGTSAGAPTRERNVSSVALVHDDGEVWLVDCGEATQHQLLRSPVRPARIRKILLTHLHGDHSFGVPGLLSSIGLHGRQEPVELIAPRGARTFVESALSASGTVLPFALHVLELDGERRFDDPGGRALVACPIVHRIACFGYVIETPPRRGRLDVAAAQAAGVTHGPDLGRLSRGEDVVLADGRLVRSESVVGPARPGLRLCILGDTSDARAIADAARGCEVLVHEATYAEALRAKALEYGHSTAAMAGELARLIGARTLVLTHFSARYTSAGADPSVDTLVAEAAAACPGTHVLAASDLMTLEVGKPS